MLGINPLPLTVVCIEGNGVRLCDDRTSDVYTHPRLAQAIAENDGQVRICASGDNLSVFGTDGSIHTSIPGEELASSLQRCFVYKRAWAAKNDPGVRRATHR